MLLAMKWSLLLTALPTSSTLLSCEYYNATCLTSSHPSAEECVGVERCSSAQHYCYVVWNSDLLSTSPIRHTSGLNVHLMGCMPLEDTTHCHQQHVCNDGRDRQRDLHFCCCSQPLCNSNFTVVTSSSSTTTSSSSSSSSSSASLSYSLSLVVVVVIVVLSLLTFLLSLSLLCSVKLRGKLRRLLFNKHPRASSPSTTAAHNLTQNEHNEGHFGDQRRPPSPRLIGMAVDLDTICGKGQFGAVIKGRLVATNELIAVKTFPLQQKSSWLAEQEVYNLPRMKHENILRFFGVDVHMGMMEQPEFWLITQYHEKGSLCDFLKVHTVGFADLLRLAHSMISGLSHLHTDIQGSGPEASKPSVAHCDFKSKNVLIKSDLTACISDFGLALIFETGKPCSQQTFSQVGTRRYMAPELLEGSIYFTREAFLRIDMYACGLVLWELVSRCFEQEFFDPPGEYRQPFTEHHEHPSIEQMLDLVVHRRERPTLRQSWTRGRHAGMRQLTQTIAQCWDQDAEARLSSANVKQRLSNLISDINTQQSRSLSCHEGNENGNESTNDASMPSNVTEHRRIRVLNQRNSCDHGELERQQQEVELAPLIIQRTRNDTD